MWLDDRRERVTRHGSNSEWSQVLSEVSQWSVWGHFLSLKYKNGLASGNRNNISKLSGVTKIGRLITSASDAIALQADLDRMNFTKC